MKGTGGGPIAEGGGGRLVCQAVTPKVQGKHRPSQKKRKSNNQPQNWTQGDVLKRKKGKKEKRETLNMMGGIKTVGNKRQSQKFRKKGEKIGWRSQKPMKRKQGGKYYKTIMWKDGREQKKMGKKKKRGT